LKVNENSRRQGTKGKAGVKEQETKGKQGVSKKKN